MTDKPTLRKKGKRSGRPPLMPSRVAESVDDDTMAKELKRRLGRRQELTTLQIIWIVKSKRKNRDTFRKRAQWLVDQEKAVPTFGANRAPTDDNLPAVERWLRDPSASSYQSAMWPRKKQKVKKKNSAPNKKKPHRRQL